MKTAVIIGCEGQDGRITFEQLTARGYKVLGVDVSKVRSTGLAWNAPVDIGKKEDIEGLLKALRPDEVYYLAAFHHSSQDQVPAEIELFNKSYDINVRGLLYFLDSLRALGLKTRLFYAASSLIFGNTDGEIQTEQTPFAPDTAYGISKLNGLLLCRYYRAKHSVFSSVGIFYNHESPYRGDSFVSKKITTAAIRILRKEQDSLVVGNLNAEADWGYAPDYVDAMHRILMLEAADDFIIATGQKHSVREFAQVTFDLLGLDWQKYVREDQSIMTRKRKALVGDSRKLMKLTSWQPSVDFKGMIRNLLKAQGVNV